MKKAFCTGTIALSLLLGIGRTADLFLNTDKSTGFLIAGSIGLRYLALLPVVILAVITGRLLAGKEHAVPHPGRSICTGRVNLLLVPLAFCSEMYGFLTLLQVLFGGIERRGHHWSAQRIMMQQISDTFRAGLFVVFGVWCLLLFMENRSGELHGKWMLHLGTAGSAAFYLHTVVRFVEQPSSWHRILSAIEIFSALSALLFVTSLLRVLYLPESGGIPAMCRNGLIAFFFCTCMALPQAIWQWCGRIPSPVSFPLAVTLGFTGILGAGCAWRAAKQNG